MRTSFMYNQLTVFLFSPTLPHKARRGNKSDLKRVRCLTPRVFVFSRQEVARLRRAKVCMYCRKCALRIFYNTYKRKRAPQVRAGGCRKDQTFSWIYITK